MSDTPYSVRVQEVCDDYHLSSPFSALSVRTLPVPATAPVGFHVTLVEPEQLRIAWQAGVPNDCNFAEWEVRIRRAGGGASPPETVFRPAEEECKHPGDRGELTCIVDGLEQLTTWDVQIRETCSWALADSPTVSLTQTTIPFGSQDIAVFVNASALGVLDIQWGMEAGQATGAAEGSWYAACPLTGWSVRLFEHQPHDWVEVDLAASDCLRWKSPASLDDPANGKGHSCQVTDVTTNMNFRIEVQEACAFPHRARDAGWMTVIMAPRPADEVQDIRLLEYSATHLTVGWTPGTQNDCVFAGWELEVRRATGPHEAPASHPWVSATLDACPELGSFAEPVCNFTEYGSYLFTGESLEGNAPHDVRIRELCAIPEASRDTMPLFPLWTAPGEWYVDYAGSQVMIVPLDVLSPPVRCYLVPQPPEVTHPVSDEFSFCYGGVARQQIDITRSDSPLGWGLERTLHCRGLSMAPFVPAPLPAKAPLVLNLFERESNRLRLGYYVGHDVGDCECAVPQIQLRRQGVSAWTDLGGECADMAFRFCYTHWLPPNTLFHGRIRLVCSDAALTSDWTQNVQPVATAPGCRWRSHSGRHSEYQCADRTFCDPSHLGDDCCDARGGRMRCPAGAPIMCADAGLTCAASEASETRRVAEPDARRCSKSVGAGPFSIYCKLCKRVDLWRRTR